MMMNCREASRLISASLDRPLTPWEQGKLRFHLFLCNNCREFTRQMRLIRVAARRAGNGEA
ncbi:zf-HC2 domain-containing protein [Crenobacter cavernae]|uniref:Zf-HC2 domain-containing protein n=1 Tax=Crenobacter cavernae TaxID=2290923 RepID=A0ABY0FFW1_9NEIS|nr:zf-HC2 domain-containing protein [Crenobacter cavernae]RXZ45275.1 zf-HC2 domain-containing protein [Crenobacter cavernae]